MTGRQLYDTWCDELHARMVQPSPLLFVIDAPTTPKPWAWLKPAEKEAWNAVASGRTQAAITADAEARLREAYGAPGG